MRTTVNNIFSFVTSLLFAICMLLSATGLTVVQYCCEGCADKGVLHILDEQCDAVALGEVHLHEGCNCGNSCHLNLLVIKDTINDTKQEQSHLSLSTLILINNIIYSYATCAKSIQETPQAVFRLDSHIPLTGSTVSIKNCSWLL